MVNEDGSNLWILERKVHSPLSFVQCLTFPLHVIFEHYATHIESDT